MRIGREVSHFSVTNSAAESRIPGRIRFESARLVAELFGVDREVNGEPLKSESRRRNRPGRPSSVLVALQTSAAAARQQE